MITPANGPLGQRQEAMVKLSNILVLILAALFSPLTVPAIADDQPDIRTLIATRQLDSAEKIIVSQMMSKPQDPELMTLLAEVRLDQGRAPEALTLLSDAERLDGVTALRAQLTGLADSAAGAAWSHTALCSLVVA